MCTLSIASKKLKKKTISLTFPLKHLGKVGKNITMGEHRRLAIIGHSASESRKNYLYRCF